MSIGRKPLAGVVALGLMVLVAWPAAADTPARPRPYVKRSPRGLVELTMGLSGGTARRTDTGRLLWKVDFYAFLGQMVLLDDGRTFILRGPWARLRAGLANLALAFWRDGRVFREYSVGDLLRDRSRIRRTVSHFFWRNNRPGPGFKAGLSADQRFYTLGLVDGTYYTFGTATGKIVKRWVRRAPPRQ
ncbi:MAG: hypothetical protein KJ621_07075 [Proteobacteria bacterium]|nr:hypothetical protein [Pseudomonadota bacterium]MBU1741447.1 hypothetical protein [Pseudomonadota bacterium]